MPEAGHSDDVRPRVERLFIMRLWREAGSQDTAAIRISVAEAGSSLRFYFSDIVDVCDFLRFRLADDANAK